VHIVCKVYIDRVYIDSENLRRDNRKLGLNVERSARGQESTKCQNIKTVKRKECIEKFL
jgi:hypothetical protein